MHCDLASLTAYSRVPSPTQPARAHIPSLFAGHSIAHRAAMEESSSAGRDGSTSRTPQAESATAAAADSQYPSAWETLERQPTLPAACTASALRASGGGPAGQRPAQSAGSLLSGCCTQCEGTVTTRSTWSACPPTSAGCRGSRTGGGMAAGSWPPPSCPGRWDSGPAAPRPCSARSALGWGEPRVLRGSLSLALQQPVSH